MVSALFSTIPDDHLGLMEGTEPKVKTIQDFLGLKTKDLGEAAGVPSASVRFDQKMPADLLERAREWAILINLVAGFFKGDRDKTYLWFMVRNPLLGGITPREMIRLGRFPKLHRLVAQALEDNRRP